jgi:N-glycosylase/DNA lyase
MIFGRDGALRRPAGTVLQFERRPSGASLPRSMLIYDEMELTQIDAPDFNLAMTLDSGQVFHWERHGDGFVGTIGDRPLYIEQRGQKLFFGSGNRELIGNYFALDHPLVEICARFPNDPVMTAAREFCRGLRIIRQPKWECLATFVCSSMKQVAHIRQISRALRQRYGKRRKLFDFQLYSFPTADRIASTSEADLRACALGYRAKNLRATARLVDCGEVDLQELGALPDEELRTRLCELPGVGAKVANCVLLFAYERLRAFPIDVWIERVLKEKYFARKKRVTSQKLRQFAENYFGEHGGYAQQYLFHHARKTHSRRRDNGGCRAVGATGKVWDTTARVPPDI